MSEREIGDEGAISLASALKWNTSLLYLYLGNNEIGDKGAIALAEALKANTSLQMLTLTRNYIGDKGAISLAEAIKWNTSLQTLYLLYLDNKNRFGDIAKKMVEVALSGPRKNPPKLSLAAANSVGLLTLPQLAAAGAYVAFVHLL